MTIYQFSSPNAETTSFVKGTQCTFAPRTNSAFCSVTLTEQFLRHAQLSLLDPDAFLIPRLIKMKNGHIAHKSAGISYAAAREAFAHYKRPLAAGGLHYIQPLAAGGLQFSPHIFRTGGALRRSRQRNKRSPDLQTRTLEIRTG